MEMGRESSKPQVLTMDEKRREEILKECDLWWLNQKLTNKLFDLVEKAVLDSFKGCEHGVPEIVSGSEGDRDGSTMWCKKCAELTDKAIRFGITEPKPKEVPTQQESLEVRTEVIKEVAGT